MTAEFDRIIVVDWSASSTPKRGADSIWIGAAGKGHAQPLENPPTRAAAMARLRAQISDALGQGARLLIAFDVGFGFPRGFAQTLTGQPCALAVWDWLAARIEDDAQNRNNRFQLAAQINRLFPGIGPFWGRPNRCDLPDLPAKGRAREGHGLAELRQTELICSGAHPMWKLYTTGAVGSQSLLAQAHLARLRREFAADIGVWPMQGAGAQVVLTETYLSLIDPAVKAARGYACKDAAQVDLLARALSRTELAALLDAPADAATLTEEGWILGAGHQDALLAALG